MANPITVSEFEALYKEYYTLLYRYAYSFINDEEKSKDVVSEVYSKVWQKREELDLTKIKCLLYVMVRNECISLLRKKENSNVFVDYCKVAEEIEDEEYLTVMDDRIAQIRQIIESMPPRTRFILEECFWKEKTYREVAEVLEISVSGVKKNIIKGYAAIREHFNIKRK